MFLITLAIIITFVIIGDTIHSAPPNRGNIQTQSTPVVDLQQSQIESLQFALQSTQLFHQSATNAELATLLAIRGLNKAYTPEAYRALHQTLPYFQGSIVLSEHTDGVRGATQLSDGRILSWSEDGTLRLWDDNGQFINTLTGHNAHVLSAFELSDGRILSWGSSGVKLWDNTGQLLTTIRGVYGTRLSDGRLITYNNVDHTLQIWDADGLLLATLSGHTDWIRGVVELSSGRIVSWSFDDTLRLWDADGQLPDELRDFACSRLARDLTYQERLLYQIRTETGEIDTSPTCP